jgi:hypothetical protein
LIIDFLILGNQPTLNPIVYAEEHVPFFPRFLNHEMPVAEILTRISTTMGFWFGTYITLQGYYSAASFLTVATGISSPPDVRPIFGPLRAAYSVRRFWG